jgi:hypothetical protein
MIKLALGCILYVLTLLLSLVFLYYFLAFAGSGLSLWDKPQPGAFMTSVAFFSAGFIILIQRMSQLQVFLFSLAKICADLDARLNNTPNVLDSVVSTARPETEKPASSEDKRKPTIIRI